VADVKTVKSSYAQLRFHAILAEMERTGESFTITQRGRPVAVLMPARRHRRFGQLPGMHVPDDFDVPLPEAEIATWQDNSPA
jgi:prevent-host-death family protein